MNYNIGGILVPAELVERSRTQRTRDFLHDWLNPKKFLEYVKGKTEEFYQEIRGLNARKNSTLENLTK